MTKLKARFVLAALLCSWSAGSHAFDFYPTQAEWMAWPDFCKARYVMFPPGSTSEFKSLVSPSMIDQARAELGSACFDSVHHYCAGLAYVGRAKLGKSDDYKLYLAEDEHSFVHRNCPRDLPFWSNNEAHLAMVMAKRGNLRGALASVDSAIKMHPGYDGAYIAKSMILGKAGKKGDSRQALLDGQAATEGRSAELNYALGLSYFEAGEYESARQVGRKAYALGYPLPGLRNKLAKAGFPIN